MFIKNGVSNGLLLLTLSASLAGSLGQAAVIGQWTGNPNGQFWAASGNFSTIYANATAAPQSHTVESAEAITTQTLSNKQFFIMAPSGSATLSGTEMTALTTWVNGGGILLLFADPEAASGYGANTRTIANDVLTSLGSGSNGLMQINAATFGNQFCTPCTGGGSLVAGDSATTGLVGSNLSYYMSYTISGGSTLGFNGAAVNTYNSVGKVYVFGERIDYGTSGQNGFPIGLTSNNTTNLQLFLNLLAQQGGGGGGGGGGAVPEPSTLVLTGFALAGVVALRRKL